ncbi:carboxypeptidase-like regulatory domain-containing protein [Mesorhizobium escarrei]|uniref:Carboxypeptidase regulatory-like domain-containing protein n=1 Tax=Mesorhizobium escarrei TaxID=666018 RepID=A0ABM9E2J4_9HYPH|nr:carboxypeptidase-like regulatory domain-containing protein [Mesorhizobium escarrei]CAH2402755.1 hypothetical protein MES5069_350037 [Mesorhizobium escarrei]
MLMGDAEKILHHGRVVRSNGEGVSEALVYVTTGTAPTPEIAIRSDGAGHFGIALPPGHFKLQARTVDGKLGVTTIVTGPEASSFEISIAD